MACCIIDVTMESAGCEYDGARRCEHDATNVVFWQRIKDILKHKHDNGGLGNYWRISRDHCSRFRRIRVIPIHPHSNWQPHSGIRWFINSIYQRFRRCDKRLPACSLSIKLSVSCRQSFVWRRIRAPIRHRVCLLRPKRNIVRWHNTPWWDHHGNGRSHSRNLRSSMRRLKLLYHASSVKGPCLQRQRIRKRHE